MVALYSQHSYPGGRICTEDPIGLGLEGSWIACGPHLIRVTSLSPNADGRAAFFGVLVVIRNKQKTEEAQQDLSPCQIA